MSLFLIVQLTRDAIRLYLTLMSKEDGHGDYIAESVFMHMISPRLMTLEIKKTFL